MQAAYAYLHSVTINQKFYKGDTQCSVEVKDHVTHEQVSETAASALLSADFIETLHPLPTCEQVQHNSVLHATIGKERTRDGSICIFKYQTTLQFGSIIRFRFASIQVFKVTEQSILDSVHTPTLPGEIRKGSTTSSFVLRNCPLLTKQLL